MACIFDICLLIVERTEMYVLIRYGLPCCITYLGHVLPCWLAIEDNDCIASSILHDGGSYLRRRCRCMNPSNKSSTL